MVKAYKYLGSKLRPKSLEQGIMMKNDYINILKLTITYLK